MPHIGQGLRVDVFVIAAISGRAGQRQDGDHGTEELVGKDSHVSDTCVPGTIAETWTESI
jgi:hypothetical protein